MGKSVPQHKKRKSIREKTIQSLIDNDLEKIADQVKEATNEYFENTTKLQEEMHSYMKE
jgi:hypothetical protein